MSRKETSYIRLCPDTEELAKHSEINPNRDDGRLIPDCKYTEGIAAKNRSAEKMRFNTSCCILTIRHKYTVSAKKSGLKVSNWCNQQYCSRLGHGVTEMQGGEMCNMSKTQTWLPGNQLVRLNPPEIQTGWGGTWRCVPSVLKTIAERTVRKPCRGLVLPATSGWCTLMQKIQSGDSAHVFLTTANFI